MKRIHAVAGAIVSIVVLALCLVGGYASAVPNNVTGADCSTLFAGSTEIPKGDMTWSGGDGDTYVTVHTVDVKWFVAGFVVKGANGYNTFSAGQATNMQAPVNPSGDPADVSHWFACGMTEEEETTETTTTTTTVETTTDTTETTTSETTSETTTSETTDTTTSTTETSDTTTSETTSGTETTTPSDTTSQTSESTSSSETTPPVVTTSDGSSVAVPTTTVVSLESNPDDLAYTGTSVLWLLLVALGLVAAGVVALLVTRRRK